MGRRRRKKQSTDQEARASAPALSDEFRARFETWATEAAEAHGLVVYDVNVRTNWLMTVFVDRSGATEPGEGVSVEELAEVSRYIEACLDADEGVWPHYTLEVSSPGVERKLTKPRHYELSLGRDARIVVHRPIDGQNVFEGALSAFDGDTVTIDTANGAVALDVKNIAKARLTYDFSE